MTKVYQYKVYDINSDVEKFIDSYATEKYIKAITGAAVMYETELEVSEIQLDGDGKLKVSQ